MSEEPADIGGITADLLRSGARVSAVLRCNRDLDPTQPEVEVLELPHLVGRGDNVWAFSRSLHGPISPLGASGRPCAYGYCTRYGLVANASHLDGLARVYNLSAYAEARFIALPPGEAVWRKGEDGAALRDAIAAGRKLRAVLDLQDGLGIGIDIHLAEYHGARQVMLYAEFDAVPAFIFAPPFLARLAEQIAAKTAERGADKPLITGLLDAQRTGFRSLYARIDIGGSVAPWDADAGRFAKPELWRDLTVFAR